MNLENKTKSDIADKIENKNTKHIVLASGSPRRREILTMLGVKFDVIVADVDESTEGMDSSDPGAIVGELSRRKALAVYDRIKRAGNGTGTDTGAGAVEDAGADVGENVGENAGANVGEGVGENVGTTFGTNFGTNFETKGEENTRTTVEANVAETVIIAADTIVYCDGRIFGKPHSHAEAAEMLSCYSGKTHAVVSGVTVLRFGAGGSPEPTVVTAHEVTEVDFKEMSAGEIERYVSTAEPYDKAGAYAVQGLAALYIKGIRGEFYNVVGLPVSLLYDIARDIFE